MAKKIQMFLGSSSDLPVTEKGCALLKEAQVGFALNIASAHRTPQFLEDLIKQSEAAVYIAVAGMSAHLAGVVASLTTKPVLAVPVYRQETAGFDALLSMSQMPSGIPVATFGFGSSGFYNACMFAMQVLAVQDKELQGQLVSIRANQAEKVIADNKKFSTVYDK